MSRLSRTAKLILAARAAARGATLDIRERGIAETATMPAPAREVSGRAKMLAGCKLKERVALLKGLDGVARTELSDSIVELANRLKKMPDNPHADDDDEEARYHWMRD